MYTSRPTESTTSFRRVSALKYMLLAVLPLRTAAAVTALTLLPPELLLSYRELLPTLLLSYRDRQQYVCWWALVPLNIPDLVSQT